MAKSTGSKKATPLLYGGIKRIAYYADAVSYTHLDVYKRQGKFFPEKAKVRIPLYYSYQNEVIRPQYNPLDQDLLLTLSLIHI